MSIAPSQNGKVYEITLIIPIRGEIEKTLLIQAESKENAVKKAKELILKGEEEIVSNDIINPLIDQDHNNWDVMIPRIR